MAENKNNKLQIRNSTVDFLVFTKDAHEDGIEVRVQDHDVWLTQNAGLSQILCKHCEAVQNRAKII